MKNARFLFVAVIAVLLTACGGPAPAVEPAPAAEQPTNVEPTTSPAEPASAAEPAQPQYAPFCETTATTGCESPTVTMLDNKYCIERVPYAIMSAPAGTTYESQDPDMECVDQMHNDGNLRITCHSISGKDLWSYDLKVCNSACSATSLQMGTGQCPEGYGYNTANQCCSAPAPSSSDGCTIYKVDLGVCQGAESN